MKRQFTYGINTLLQIVIFLGILVAVNALPRVVKNLNLGGSKIPLQKEWDLTKDRKYSLSDQTVKVLNSLKAPVKAIVFVQKFSPDEQQLKPIMKRYAFQSTNFNYEVVDPEKNPLEARKYDVKQLRTIVLEMGKHRETVNLGFSTDSNGVEAKLTSALLRLQNPTVATVYFTKGHGEEDPDNTSPQGLSMLKGYLQGENYVVKSIYLFQSKEVPADCTVLVVAGLKKDFFPSEIDLLNKYMARGGRILWMANLPLSKRQVSFTNAEGFLKAHGIEVNHDLVVSIAMLNINSPERILIPAGVRYGTHPITQSFNVPSFYMLAQSLKVDRPPFGANLQPLVFTNDNTIEYTHPLQAWTRVVQMQNPMASYNPRVDHKGAATLAIAGTYPTSDAKKPAASPSPAPSAAPATRTEARMVVFGNAAFASGQMVGVGGNSDLLLNSVAWLAQRTEQISIKRATTANKPVTLDEATRDRLFRIGFPLMPCLVALTGIMVHMLLKKH